MTFCGRQLQKYVEKCATKELATADERSRRCREPWGAIVSGRGCCCGGHIAISNSLLVDNISATERTIIIPYRTYGGERASKWVRGEVGGRPGRPRISLRLWINTRPWRIQRLQPFLKSQCPKCCILFLHLCMHQTFGPFGHGCDLDNLYAMGVKKEYIIHLSHLEVKQSNES